MVAPDLIKAVQSGSLEAVKAALDAGVSADLNDGEGEPGLPLGMACYLGHAEIVRELVKHGGKVNLADNNAPISPLSMAIRGGRTRIVRLLIELGANVPPGMKTGLSEREMIVAKWSAGNTPASAGKQELPQGTSIETLASFPGIEEIDVQRIFGTDTVTLEEDALRASSTTEPKKTGRR